MKFYFVDKNSSSEETSWEVFYKLITERTYGNARVCLCESKEDADFIAAALNAFVAGES